MFRHWLGYHGSWLPEAATVLFFGMAVVVLWYVLTDRRRQHLTHMESLPLEDEVDHG